MKIIKPVFHACVLSLALSGAYATQLPPRIMIKFKNNEALTNVKKATFKSLGLKASKVIPMANKAYVVEFHRQGLKSSIDDILQKLNQRDDVKYAVKDKVGYFKPEPKVPGQLSLLTHTLQWDEFSPPQGVHLESSAGQEDGAWQYNHGESATPVVVGVLDTGIELNPRLRDNLMIGKDGKLLGWNFAANNDELSDETGSYHGTHVAGTIASSGYDMIGMGPKLKILPIKIPDSSGMFYESAVINGIYWALGHQVPGAKDNPYPVKVMNMSFGIDEAPGKEVDFCDAAVQEAVDTANHEGAVIVVAAGNNNSEDDLGSPGGCEGVIRVTSTGPTGLRAYYSNYGESSTYAAPGGDKRYGQVGGILSTVKPGMGVEHSGLDFYQGTSMATPHVAGLFGLVFAYGQGDNITGEQAKDLIYATTHDFGESEDENESCVGRKSCGHGIIDANLALQALSKGYTKFISSPRITSSVSQTGCPNGMVKALKPVISDKAGVWRLKTNQCTKLTHISRLELKQGQLVANYAGIRYQLDGDYSSCQLIGIDGIGCR